MNECLTTPQHKNRSAIECQKKVNAQRETERDILRKGPGGSFHKAISATVDLRYL